MGLEKQQGWSYEWVKHIVLSENFRLMPLQMANAKRIEYSDAVYIFDEVGCGKTISAGLIALNYLYNHPGKRVQVITINALVQKIPGKAYGQFLKDWMDKLPFEALGLAERIDICNNNFSNLSKVSQRKDIGLLIVDEAHLFLGSSRNNAEAMKTPETEDTLKCRRYLKKIHAKKAVFLTATPIKNSVASNLQIYSEIAGEILGKPSPVDFAKELSLTEGEPICARFHEMSPVSRYFKDTVKMLEAIESKATSLEKKDVKRLIPQIWQYNYGHEKSKDKVKALIKGILERPVNEEGQRNRFVVFVMYVEREANVIVEEMLSHTEFTAWNGAADPEGRLTVVSVNGKSEHRPTEFSHNGVEKDLPDVLIITYGIAEQGLNLPGYNYVVNYHISAFPSSLEQRFGRIDRMGQKNGSPYKTINMAYLIIKDDCDTSKTNFYNAVWMYRQSLITCLPAKNVLLTKEILELFEDDRELMSRFVEKLVKELDDEHGMEAVFRYFQTLNGKGAFNAGLMRGKSGKMPIRASAEGEKDELVSSQEGAVYDADREEEETRKYLKLMENPLVDFCRDNNLFEHDFPETQQDLRQMIIKELRKYKNMFQKDKETPEDAAALQEIRQAMDTLGGKVIGDKIFYWTEDRRMMTMDAKDAALKIAAPGAPYHRYLEWFLKISKLPMIVEKWRDALEDFFEESFLQDRLDDIFLPDEEYEELLRTKVLTGEAFAQISEEEKQLLCKNAAAAVKSLPFFAMFLEYRRIIWKLACTEDGRLRMKFDFDILHSSLQALMCSEVLPEKLRRELEKKPFGRLWKFFETEEIDGNYRCSKWFRLFYLCMDTSAMSYRKAVSMIKELTLKAERRWEELRQQPDHMLRTEFEEPILEILRFAEEICRNQYNRLSLYWLFINVQTDSTGEWRKPYRGGDEGGDTSKWSYLLPREPYRRGYRQIWRLKDYRKADFWTYMIYSHIAIYQDWHQEYRYNRKPFRDAEYHTLNPDWWIRDFLPNRCVNGSECSLALEKILEKNVEKYLDRGKKGNE